MENLQNAFDSRLDNNLLFELYEGDMEHAAMVFEQFLKTSPIQMREIEDSFQEGEVELFRQKIHKMKPVFSFVGLSDLTHTAEILEKKCKEIFRIGEIESLYLHLKTEYLKGISIIQNESKRLEEQIN